MRITINAAGTPEARVVIEASGAEARSLLDHGLRAGGAMLSEAAKAGKTAKAKTPAKKETKGKARWHPPKGKFPAHLTPFVKGDPKTIALVQKSWLARTCPTCGRRFQSLKMLHRHVRRHEKTEKREGGGL